MSDEFVTLSLGGGGKQTADFIKETILKNFDNEIIARMGDDRPDLSLQIGSTVKK